MIEFVNAFFDPDNAFLRIAIYVATLSSISFGIIGTYVVTRRISYLAGAISHCVFGGIGAGLYIQKEVGISWFEPMYGAVISAILAAIIIGLVSLYARQREDTVIGALWAVGMAAGLIFVDLTPGYFDITSYLFGDILLISMKDLWMVVFLDVLVVAVSIYFYNILLAVCFDQEFAGLRGVYSGAFYILLLCLTSLTIVLLVRVVGIVMVIALLTLPAAVAGQFSRRLWQMMVLAVIFCMIFNWTGLALSYSLNLSSGPTIIIIAGITYIAVISFSRIFHRIKQKSS
ncbi:MAG: metal ABC transporter permease [Deltaproteobacteria bacterium]|nr:metal ABC transporter permease [Deltaproteobacteria bacterium]